MVFAFSHQLKKASSSPKNHLIVSRRLLCGTNSRYIDVCYENYNSTGNQGIIDELREFIEMQGGSVA